VHVGQETVASLGDRLDEAGCRRRIVKRLADLMATFSAESNSTNVSSAQTARRSSSRVTTWPGLLTS
jgi:hypothetical protein